MTKAFEEGDLVAVFGGEIGKDKQTGISVTLCSVLLCGQDDLLVEWAERFGSTRHVVPKSICVKLSINPKVLVETRIATPQIGDLVLSYKKSFKSEGLDTVSGILYKITYKLGKPDSCDIMCGTDMISAPWDSLIVLRRSSD